MGISCSTPGSSSISPTGSVEMSPYTPTSVISSPTILPGLKPRVWSLSSTAATSSRGVVEHDPEGLWRAPLAVLGAVLAGGTAERVRGLGIATQRGTALVWEAATGRAVAPGLSWQDGRAAARCNALMAEGVLVSPL